MEKNSSEERLGRDYWVGNEAIIKNTANLQWLIPIANSGLKLIVTDDNGKEIQINEIPKWLSKDDFEKK